MTHGANDHNRQLTIMSSQIKNQKRMLMKALADERFEEAALIRDEITHHQTELLHWLSELNPRR